MPRGKSKKKAEVSNKIANWLIGAMLFVVSGVMPLAVHAALRPTPPELWDLIVEKQRADTFAYWRGWLLIIPALIIVLYTASELLTGGRKDFDIKKYLKNPPVAASAVYLFFMLLSNIFSEYPYTALHGTIDRFEGVFVQLAYIVIFITVLYYARSLKQVKIIIAGIIISSLFAGAVGLSQILGHDFFATDWGSIYITGQPGKATPAFTQAYGVLFNPNTWGLYTSMLAPVLLLCGFTYKDNKLVNVLTIAAGALMLAGIPGSRSLGGWLGASAAVAAIVITYLANRIVTRQWPHWFVYVAIALVAVGSAYVYKKIPAVNENVTSLIAKLKESSTLGKKEPPVDYIFDGGSLTLTQGQGALVSLNATSDEWLIIKSGSGDVITETEAVASADGTNTVYYYDVPDYGRIAIARFSDYFLFDGMYMAVVEGKIIPFRQSGIAIDISKPIRAIGFEGYETWATYRGYIWSRSIPLLLTHAIIGSGSDTFINEFPQDDIVGKRRFMNNPYIIVDKAHNIYLQTGITTGGVSMLALIFLLGYYMVTTFISLVKSKGEPGFSFGLKLGILAAVSAFSVASMSTDSTIPSTGVFMVILGLGYALNAWTDNSEKQNATLKAGK